MFGKTIRDLLIAAVLIGFCVYILRLFAIGGINLYIHPRYNYFTAIMCGIALLVLVTGIALQIKKPIKQKFGPIKFLDILALAVLLLAFILPAQALSSKAIGRKALNVPTYDLAIKKDSRSCPSEKPESVELWVSQISQYPVDCFKGKSISLTGFVFESKQAPLPNNMYYLGRVFISCCVIDSRPYALPIKADKFPKYPKDTWLKVDGTLELNKLDGRYRLIVEASKVKQIKDPSQPYEFYGQSRTGSLE